MSCLRATKPLFTEDIHQVKRPIQDRLKKVYTLSLSLSLNERHRDCLYEGSTQYGGKWLACHFWVNPCMILGGYVPHSSTFYK